MLADESQLTQVIMNFCLNARDAMPYGGKIEIRTKGDGLSEAVAREHPEVKSGSFSLTNRHRQWNRDFFGRPRQYLRTLLHDKGARQGHGLGLSTVYGIVRQTGGCIDVESQVGNRTVFRVYFLPFRRTVSPSFPSHRSRRLAIPDG